MKLKNGLKWGHLKPSKRIHVTAYQHDYKILGQYFTGFLGESDEMLDKKIFCKTGSTYGQIGS